MSFELFDSITGIVILKDSISATSDYSAAITDTGFATEIARKDTYARLSDTVADKIITKILINFSDYKNL